MRCVGRANEECDSMIVSVVQRDCKTDDNRTDRVGVIAHKHVLQTRHERLEDETAAKRRASERRTCNLCDRRCAARAREIRRRRRAPPVICHRRQDLNNRVITIAVVEHRKK